MEVTLKNEKYDHFVPVFHELLTDEFSVDSVVPDTMPDIQEVLGAEGTLLLRGKATEAGSVLLTASVNSTVLYAPENGDFPRFMPVLIPIEFKLKSQQISEECRVVCRMRLRALDTKMMNSRKISVHASVAAEVWCYKESVLEISSLLESNDVSAHTLKRNSSLVHVSDVREKTFVITDQYSMPGGFVSPVEILQQHAEVFADDVKFVGGKVVFRGHVNVHLLLSGRESGALLTADYETDFSQIMEVDTTDSDTVPEINLLLTAVYLDLPGSDEAAGKIDAEIHMAAICICRKSQEIEYIDDLYSNRTVLIPVYRDHTCVLDVQSVSMRQTVTGRVELSGESEVIQVSAVISGISQEKETVKTTINVRVLCRQPSGCFVVGRCRLGAEFTTDLTASEELQNVRVRVVDVYYSVIGEAVDLRVVLQMDGHRVTVGNLTYVEEVSIDEEAETNDDLPSITLVAAGQTKDLWRLAKQYCSSPESIAAANEGNNGELLLIPKCR